MKRRTVAPKDVSVAHCDARDDVLPSSARACPGPQPCLAWNVSLPHPVSGSVALSPTGKAVCESSKGGELHLSAVV